MKWIVLVAIVIATFLVAGQLKSDRRHLRIAAFWLGFLPFLEGYFHLFAAPIVWPMWQGIAKGIQISASDGLAFAVFITSPKVRSPTTLRIAFALVVLAFTVSTVASGIRMESLFFGWGIVRAVVVYIALLRATSFQTDTPLYALSGLIVGLVTQAVVVIYQYGTGAVQAGGWFGHQNLLGFTTHFVVYPAFAAFLGGFYRKRMLVALFAGIIIAFTGASRATIGLLLAGCFITTGFSLWHERTGRKAAVVAAALIAGLMITPILYSAIERRPVEQREGSSEERELMKSAAAMIFADNPLGVGANRYVVVANMGGYLERAGVPWGGSNRAAPVHNSYYLVTAEMGWLGLAALVGLFVAGLSLAIGTFRRAARGLNGELAAGIAAAIVMAAIHAYYEWIFFSDSVLYLLALSLGIVGGLNAHLRRTAGVRPSSLTTSAQLISKPAVGSITPYNLR